MTKFRDILKGTMFESRINRLIDLAKNKWCRNLGQNDFIHSESVENHLDNLVPDEIKYNENIFEKAEIFLLLYGVYLHDIGRKTNKEPHERETYNEILKNHKEYLLENKFEAAAVANICYGHAKESEIRIKDIDDEYGIQELCNRRPLNLQFLAALLRLADEIDNTYIRVRGLIDQDGNPRNMIRFIRIDTRRWIIEFQCDIINDEDEKKLRDGEKLVQDRLNEIKSILEQKGLLYHLIHLDIKKRSKINREGYDENVDITGFIYELNNRANAFNRLGRYEDAIELCDKAIKIDPRYSLVWLNKGNALDGIKKYKEAIECYDKALEIDPKNLAALNNKGTTLNNNFKMYKEAIELFDKILEIDPKNVLALNNKSNTLYNWGDDIYNSGVALAELAKTKDSKEKEELLKQSIEKYELAFRIKSDKYDVINNWGNVLAELAMMKEGKEKEELLKRSIEKHELAFITKPDFYQGLYNVAIDLEELAKMKEGKEKEELLKRAFEKRETANDVKNKNIK